MGGETRVMFVKPVYQRLYFPIGPHPSGPAIEFLEYLDRISVTIYIMLYIAVYTIKVGPIALYGNEIEIVFLDESFAYGCPPSIIFVGAM
jgi:hypothetical protein